MLVFFKFFKVRQMLRHFSIRKPLAIHAVIPHRQRNEMVSHNTTDIQVVMRTLQGLIMKEFMSCVSQGISGIRHLSPHKWEASPQPCGYACKACQPDTTIILHFRPNCKSFLGNIWSNSQGRFCIPNLKDWVLVPKL